MKRIFLFLSLCTICLSVSAQSLNFSRVVIVKSVEDTVPAGKVWKLENYFQRDLFYTTTTEPNSCNTVGYHHPFYINGNKYWVGETGGISSPGNYNRFPFWLPAGYRLRTNCPDDMISIIEFTVVP